MKKTFTVWILSLLLLFSLVLLNTNQTNAATGEISLHINTGLSSCIYGTSLDLGEYQASYSMFSVTGTFSPETFSCTDFDGLASWSMTFSATTDLTGSNWQVISKNNVFLKVNPNIVTAGVCSTWENTNTVTSIWTTAWVILAKTSSIAQICTISATGIELSITIPPSQAIGTYTWILSLTSPW